MAELKSLIVNGVTRLNNTGYAKQWYAEGVHHTTVDSDNYVVLAGGGYTSLSNLANSHNHDDRYVNVTGDTMTGMLTIKNNSWNNILTLNRTSASGTWGPAIVFQYDGTSNGTLTMTSNQLYIGDNGSNRYKAWHEGNDGSGSGLDADLLDGLHGSSFVKFYLSPMTSNAPADSAKSWFVNTMPSSSGAIVYNVPGSEKTIIAGKSSGAYGHMLQLNYDDNYLRILRYKGGTWQTTDWEKISAGYADSAGNADTLDGIHASGLFTAFSGGEISSSNNTLTQANHSITIGGTNKTAGSSTATIINSNSLTGSTAKSTSTSTYNLSLTSTVNGIASTKSITKLWSSYIDLQDIRGTDWAPNHANYPEKSIIAWFNSTGTPTSNWYSGITVKGWTNDYASWQLTGYSSNNTTTDDNLYFRNGINGTWKAWRTILDSSNSSVSSTANSITVKINGTTATLTNTNTDTLVNQSQTTTSSWRPVILGYQSSSKSSTALYTNVTNVVYTTNVLQYQPSTGLLSTTRLDLTQATGTAPMTIASTTLVSNLNADLLDGLHATTSGSLFYKYTHTATINQSTISGDYWYATISFTRSYVSELTKSIIYANYSNVQGIVYLNTYTYNGDWYAYTTDYNGCNIIGISRKSQNNPIYYIKLKKPVTYSGSIPDGTITCYSTYDFTITTSATAPSNVTFTTIDIPGFTNLNSNTTTKLKTARSITVGNKTNTFDGTSNISFSLSDIGVSAAGHQHYIGTTQTQSSSANQALTGITSIDGIVDISPTRGTYHFDLTGTDADYGVARIIHKSTAGSGSPGAYTASLAILDQRTANISGAYEPTFFINRTGATRVPDLIGVNVGGARVFTIDSSQGYIGIGITSCSAPLHIAKDTPGLIRLFRTNASGGAFIDYYNANQTTNYWRVGASANGEYDIYRNGSTGCFTILSDGKVGIGTRTPSYKLHVAGNAMFSLGGNLSPSSGSSFSQGYSFNIVKSTSELYGLHICVEGSGNVIAQSSAMSAAYYNLSLNPLGGNVGVGTSSPSYKLHVAGTGYISGETWLNTSIYIIAEPGISLLKSTYGLPSDYTSNYNTENYLKAWSKYAYAKAAGRSVIGYCNPSSRGFIQADIYNSGLVTQDWKNANTSYPNAEIGLPIHITGRYYPHGGEEIIFGTSYGTWYYRTALNTSNYSSYLGYIATTQVKSVSTPGQNITGTGNITPNSANSYTLGGSTNGFSNVYASTYNIMHSSNGTEIRGTIAYNNTLIGSNYGIKLATNSNGPNFQVDASTVYLNVSTGTGLYVYGGSYYLQFRPESSTWASFYTNSTKYYFNKRIDVAGAIWRYNTNYGIDDNGRFYALAMYANRASSSTDGGVSLYGTDFTYSILFRGTDWGGKLGRVQADWATYLTMNGTAQRGWIFRNNSTGNVASISNAGEAYFSAIGKNDYIAYPNGGSSTGNGGTVTGAIAIKLPTTAFKSSTMIKFAVEIYNYSSGTSCTYHIAGYNYSSGNWVNISAYSIRQGTDSKGNLTVRFGKDSSRNIIWIGETNSSWSYPQVYVRDVTLGHSNIDYNKWATGWSVSFVTAFDTVDTSVNNPATNYIANYASSAGNADTVDGKHASDFATSGHTHTFANITTKITHSDEFNFVDSEKATIWFNYRRASDSSAATPTTQFNFCQGTQSETYAYLLAKGYKKSGSTDSYVLLGGGGHTTLSSLSSTHSHSQYVLKAGDTMTGMLTIKNNSWNNILTLNRTSASGTWGPAIVFQYDGTSNGTLTMTSNQLYIGDNGSNRYKAWHEGNDGTGSGLDADLLDGKHYSDITAYMTDHYVPYDLTTTRATVDGTNSYPHFYNLEGNNLITNYLSYWYIINMGKHSGNNYAAQLATPYQNTIDDSYLFVRTADGTSWRDWRRLLSDNDLQLSWTKDRFKIYPGLRKFENTTTRSAWDSEVYSKNGYTNNIVVTFKPGQNNKHIMVGLNADSPVSNWSNLDYVWYLQADGKMDIRESGSTYSSISGHTTYNVNDEFRVEYSTGEIRYYHNNTLCRTVTKAAGTKLYFEASFYSGGYIYDVEYTTSLYKTSEAINATNATNVIVNQNSSSDALYPLVWSTENNSNDKTSNQLRKTYDYLCFNPNTKLLRLDGGLLLRPGRDATLKIYSGKVTDSYSDGFIKLQTSIDGTDGETHSHPGNYQARCALFLQPRGGEVYIGKDITAASTSASTAYKLNVGGSALYDGNIYINTGDNDRFIQFSYNSNNYAGAAWRLLSRGSGSGDTNYFDIETGGSSSSATTWNRVIRLTMDNRRVGIGTDSPSEKLHVEGNFTASNYRIYGENYAVNANNTTCTGIWYYTSNGPSTSLGASTADGALYSQAYSTSWVAQIAQDYRNGSLFVRGKNNGTWSSWKAVLDNINRHAIYGTTGSTNYIKIKINSTRSWMLSFMVRVYQDYNHYDIVFSGYNYGSNYWYSPQATLASSTTNSIVVYFGYESANNLFVVITGGSYTGLEILNVTNGFTQIDDKLVLSNLFTVTNSSSLPTTIQKTDQSGKLQNICDSTTGAITIYRPWLRNETVTNATNATNATNVYIEGASGDVNYPLLFTNATANSNGRIYADSQWRTAGITFNPSSNVLNVPYVNNIKFKYAVVDSSVYTTSFRAHVFGESTSTKSKLSVVRFNSPCPNEGYGYGTGIAFQGSDTQGMMVMQYNSPGVCFSGGSTADQSWWMKITGSNGSSYDLSSFVTGGPYLPLSGGWMGTDAIINFKGKNSTTSAWGKIGYMSTTPNGLKMHLGSDTYNTKALYIVSNGYDAGNDNGGLAIDNDGVTVFGAGDTGSVFRVLNEDNVNDGAQFYVTKAGGATTKYSHTAQRFISTVATNTQPYACNSTTLNTNLNADMTDNLHVTSGSRNNEVNKIVKTDANGYIQAGWINTTSGAMSADTAIDRVYCSNDGYIRYKSKSNFISEICEGYVQRLRRVNLNITSTYLGMIPPAILELFNGYHMYTDPTFVLGKNSISVYDNNNCGSVTVTQQNDNQNSGNGSGKILKIHSVASGASPNGGGWYFGISGTANRIYVCVFRAKIPVGYNVNWHSNSIGSGGSSGWLTETAGTGKWEWYAYMVEFGSSPSSTFFFSLTPVAAVDWYLSYANVIWINQGVYDSFKSSYSDNSDNANNIYVYSAANNNQASGFNPTSFTAGYRKMRAVKQKPTSADANTIYFVIG